MYLSVIRTFFLWSQCQYQRTGSLIVENSGQCDVTLWCLIQLQTITSVLRISTHIITRITICPTGLAAILAIMSISTSETCLYSISNSRLHLKYKISVVHSQENTGLHSTAWYDYSKSTSVYSCTSFTAVKE